MSDYLLFKPLYQERVWGGRTLETVLGRKLPADQVIGESWEVVDRPEAQSVVARGPHAGMNLHDVLLTHNVAIMGPTWGIGRPFPILIKWLDCCERLSLQVHPPASIAASLNGEPKTENWFIAHAGPNASLIVGLKRGVTREQFEKAIDNQTVEKCVHRFPVSAGDSILVQSGVVHAIDAGNVILEIQQNSDTTYRVYDWGRVGLDGKPRALHVEQSLKSIKWDVFEPSPLRASAGPAVLADCPEFRIRRLPLASGEATTFAGNEQPRLVSVVNGRLNDGRGPDLVAGDNILLPYAASVTFTASENTTVLITENFVP
ncbi:MAG TPA: type I phosphomannose isomerase catalytic subunit [Opitutaceae bacterium]|nr:type I phosphomannose isomerase catalytic subunit [Opitutaceae bacterium]